MSVRSIFLFFICICLSSCIGMGGHRLAPVVHYGQGSGSGSAGAHVVSSGDTLYSISQRYNLPMRDIAVINRLKAPFILRAGQRLNLPPPREYRVRTGDTLYGVSRLFDANATEVARMNNLRAPYILNVGQTLRLPSIVAQESTVKSAVFNKNTGQAARVAAVEKTVLSPPEETVIKDGVPMPKNKPQEKQTVGVIAPSPKQTGPVRVARVTGKTPSRASSKFLKPVQGKVISAYGAKKSGLHNDGINIAAARGTPVKAAENGVVVYAGNALKGSGNLILLRHEDQWMTAYAHLDKITMKQGQIVKRGQEIGRVGASGSVSTPQLHFEVRRGTSAVNPVKYME